MNYLSIENLTKYYGEILLFKDISFNINRGDKVAIVAANGTGKTTLMNIISGKDIPETGTITINKNIHVEYLPQEPLLNEKLTVIDEIFQSESGMSTAIKNYTIALELNDIKKIEQATEEMDRLQAWDFDNKIKQILSILKIHDTYRKINQLSGGQKKRVAFAKILVSQPDFLMLDEPTNHLDLEMIEWLEEYLLVNDITLLMVTHDRYFLERVCNNIIELDNNNLYKYQGNYSNFIQKRAERYVQENAKIQKAKNLMTKELDWIRRQPKARGTKAKYRIQAFEQLRETAETNLTKKELEITNFTQRLGKKIIECENISKSYGNIKILQDFSYKFSRYEKAGIIGHNGSGKTTFLNIITQIIPPDKGKIIHGETVNIGYYKQEGIIINPTKKVIEVITDITETIKIDDGNYISPTRLLEDFLFSPAIQHTQVGKLSGGERKRLYLLTVLIQKPNFLILDEPTNDLDILTLGILEEYLQDFKGCVLIVSHDRFFMDKIVDHLFIFEGNGEISLFPGNYSDYREYQKKEKKNGITEIIKNDKNSNTEIYTKKSEKKLSYKEQKELETLEKEISTLEERKSVIESELSKNTSEIEKIQSLANELQTILEQISEKELRWMELEEKKGG
ncbi:MAG: ABC-F family ATP-binding cassette domain-containing protein [Bacteroidales bacterium]